MNTNRPTTEIAEIRRAVARAICRAGSGGSAPLEARNWERYRDLYDRDADAALAVVTAESAGALREAADFIAETSSIGANASDYANGWYHAMEYAVGELRNRADRMNTPPGSAS